MPGSAHAPIAVFHHGVLSSPLCSLGDMALEVFWEQMQALKNSGLAEAATEIHCGMNESDLLLAASIMPERAQAHSTGDGSQGEKPTLLLLEQWVKTHPGWLVCYHHMKGCTNGKHVARRCMEGAVIWNWRQCIRDLESGFDAVGCHWLDWRKHPIPRGHRIFGGNFWWTTQRFLSELPPLDPKVHETGKYFEGEIWLGRHPGEIRVADYHKSRSLCAL